jgi:hypothetical protein
MEEIFHLSYPKLFTVTEALFTVVLNTITPNPRILDIMKLEQIHFMVVKK